MITIKRYESSKAFFKGECIPVDASNKSSYTGESGEPLYFGDTGVFDMQGNLHIMFSIGEPEELCQWVEINGLKPCE